MKGKHLHNRKSKRKPRPPRRTRALAVRPAASPVPAGPARGRASVPRNARRLMRAIFARNDPVDIAGKLLREGSDATKAKVFVQCLEYLYGKPVQPVEARGAGGEKIEYQYVSNVPRPKYPPAHYVPAASAANASGAEAPGTILASRSNDPESSSD